MQKSHKHHYVPEWYQRRFMAGEQTAYYRLDMRPEIIRTPSGNIKKSEIQYKGPTKFFFESHLYTTKYFGVENDDIEKYLFGVIDSKGSAAVSAMASKNWMREIHPYFIDFFEYMDAQRLRTPKGLTWLTRLLKPSTHNELLLLMQKVRRMHCTMWVESVMEVVSAEDSEVKFIVGDNPITFYNPVFYPGNYKCQFPYDPGIELKGTRTIFPLDLNHCVILTNREYAQSPGRYKAGQTRTNPRFFDNTIARYDNIIRNRKLNKHEVSGINYIVKSRSHRFIAAADKSWLYPENLVKKTDWYSLDKLLISNSFSGIGYRGETFIGGKDGKLIAMQDDFGRKPKNQREWAEKERKMQAMKEHVEKLLKKERGGGAI
jgi:hypothetical protein